MFNPLELKKRFVQSQIEKSFSDELEKAHNAGDPHPKNPNLVWTEYTPGKFDWRKKGGRQSKSKGGNTSDAIWNDKHSGSKSPSFEGAVKADDLKVGDKLVSKSGKTLTVIGVNNKTANSVDIGVKFDNPEIGDGIHWMTFNRSGYLGAKKVDDSAFNNSKEQKFKQSFKDASDDVLQKVVNGNIQATSEEKKWAQDILDERKKSDVKTKAAKKIIDLLKVTSSKYTDISKVVAWKTDKGNYYIDYDGAETGIIINKNALSDKDFKNAGVKVEGDNKVDDTSSNDPRDKYAQEAGFKDYSELRAWQEYGTAKSLLKKKSTNDSLRKQLEDKIAKYEKEHADVIKRISEKKDVKSKSDVEIDETTIDQAEYDSQLKQAKQVDDSSRSMAKNIIQGNIDKTKKKLQETISSRPGAKATIAALQKDLTKFISQKKAVEDAENKKNSGNSYASIEKMETDWNPPYNLNLDKVEKLWSEKESKEYDAALESGDQKKQNSLLKVAFDRAKEKNIDIKAESRKTNDGNFKGMKFTDILDSLDDWEDEDWSNGKLNDKLTDAIKSAIKKEGIDEKKFNEIAKKYKGLDLVYSDYAGDPEGDFAKLLKPLDDWEDEDWNDDKKNKKLSSDIKGLIMKHKMSESDFRDIAKKHQGLDLVYTDYVPKNSDLYKKYNGKA